MQFKGNKLFLGIIITKYVVRKQLKKYPPRQFEESHIPALGWPLQVRGTGGGWASLTWFTGGTWAWSLGSPGHPQVLAKKKFVSVALHVTQSQAVNPQVEPSLLPGNLSWGEKHARQLGWSPPSQTYQEALNPCGGLYVPCPLENATAGTRQHSLKGMKVSFLFCLP